jgi:ferritin
MFYKQPKPETIARNKETNKKLYAAEIKWLSENLDLIQSNKFIMDMYRFLINGTRKITPKMIEAVRKNMNSPKYNVEARAEKLEKLTPIVEKINLVLHLAEKKGDKAVGFVQKVKDYVRENYRITPKQMQALNKVYKRVSEDLFKEE